MKGENTMLLSFFQFFLIIYLIPLWTFRFPDFLLTQKFLSTLSSCLIQCTLWYSTIWISSKTTICFLFHKARSRLSALKFLPFTPHLQTSCQAMRLSSPFHSWKFQLLFSQSRLIQPPVFFLIVSWCRWNQNHQPSLCISLTFSLEFFFSSTLLTYKQAQVIPKLRNKKVHFESLHPEFFFMTKL